MRPAWLWCVSRTTRASATYADLFSSKLKLNGRSLLELGSDYLQLVASTPEEMGPSSERLLAFRPNVVLLTSGGVELINTVEAAWPAKEPRPYWVSLGVFTNEEATKLEATFRLGDRRLDFKPLNQRMVGVDTRSGLPALLRFVARRNEVKQPPITRFEAIGFPYDSFYLAAYLLAASTEDPSNGLSLVKELPRLASGPSVDVGQAGILSVFDALARGDSINLEGATTSLDFNYETGDPKVELVPYCVTPVGDGPAARLRPSEVTSADACLGPI